MLGQTLGSYRIESQLGSGGMGAVYLATVTGHCPGLDEGARVALKLIHPHLLEQPGFFRRFLREAQIGATVRHPNVVRTHLADAIGAHHFLVMEYVEGQTLRELIEELGRVPEELCRHIAAEVARGLQAIHAAGVVHRDLKPENVIISTSAARPDEHVAERTGGARRVGGNDRDGNVIISTSVARPDQRGAERATEPRSSSGVPHDGDTIDPPAYAVKLMDLGVARLADETVRLSQSGAFVGSIEYAAPEQFGAQGADTRADLHALGVVLYELATGRHPYPGDDFRSVMRAILDAAPRRIGDVNPQLSPFFEELVHTLLAKDPAERFPSAADIVTALDAGEASAWWSRRESRIRGEDRLPLRRVRIPRETAVHGRDAEIERLEAEFARARGGEGRVVLIEGEAGVGKTRLVDEFVSRLRAGGDAPDFLYGSYTPTRAATAEGAFSTAFRERFGKSGAAEYLTETPLLVPAFDALLRGGAAPRDCEPLTRDSMGTCFVHAARALARRHTTVLLIDDLHFAPEESRELFTALALAVPGHRLLLVGTTRPGLPVTWVSNLTRPEHVSHIRLDRLGGKDVAALLVDAFHSERLAEELGFRIIQKSDGNPFFLFEILRGLREGQFISQAADGTWVSTRVIDDIAIPSSVMDLVNARVADLSEAERDLLDVAACRGFEFEPGLVADATGTPRIVALKRLAQIERKHRLVRSSGRAFVFDHHQIQEALHDALPAMLREEYHALLAGSLEASSGAAECEPGAIDGALAVDLCRHFLRGASGARAARYLEPALEHLQCGHLNAEVAALAQRSLDTPGMLADEPRLRLLLRLCRPRGIFDQMGARNRQRAASEEAVRLAARIGDESDRVTATMSLGVSLTRVGEHGEALRLLREALALAAAGPDRELEATVTGLLGAAAWEAGRTDEAAGLFRRQAELSRDAGYRSGEATATGNLGFLLSARGRRAEAEEYKRRALALFQELGDRQGEASSIGNLATQPYLEGRLTEARALYARHLELCREIGYRQGEAIANGNLGNVDYALGRLDRAAKHHVRLLELAREIGFRPGEALALYSLGNLALEEGRSDDGLALLEQAREVAAPRGYARMLGATIGLAIGAERRERGDTDGARAEFTAALEHAERNGMTDQAVQARCQLAGLPGGDVEAAVVSLREHEDQLVPHTRQSAHWLLWLASGDSAHLTAARDLLERALSLVPGEYHEAMRTRVIRNRDILEACKEHDP